MGVASGVAAANGVTGGDGRVGPYCGGWQINAMGLEDTRPDTLWVKPEDPGKLAYVLNNFIRTQDKILTIDTHKELDDIAKLPKDEVQPALRQLQDKVNRMTDFYDLSMLADLEQGYGDAKKIRYAVETAINNGISVLHIEDQGPAKRCGHLGDKELDTFDHACDILTAANYAAQEVLGPDQVREKFVRFVARTDALDAKRICYSKRLEEPSHPDHPFIDWERGATPDGKYLYLRTGINDATGNPWGMDLAIARSSGLLAAGLADFSWMETPDASVRVAAAYAKGVTDNLAAVGKKPFGFLYNFSPSFHYQRNYYPEANKLAAEVGEFVRNNIATPLRSGSLGMADARRMLGDFVSNNGDKERGDHLYTEKKLDALLSSSLDLCDTAEAWEGRVAAGGAAIDKLEPSALRHDLKQRVEMAENAPFDPLHHMTHTIIDQRISYFSEALEGLGYNLQLTTLPQFHLEAKSNYMLSAGMRQDGIHAYVNQVQSVESDLPESYTFLGHQKAVGTGVEAALYSNLWGMSRQSNILAASTEKDFVVPKEGAVLKQQQGGKQ
jgi:isocitrate lyase